MAMSALAAAPAVMLRQNTRTNTFGPQVRVVSKRTSLRVCAADKELNIRQPKAPPPRGRAATQKSRADRASQKGRAAAPKPKPAAPKPKPAAPKPAAPTPKAAAPPVKKIPTPSPPVKKSPPPSPPKSISKPEAKKEEPKEEPKEEEPAEAPKAESTKGAVYIGNGKYIQDDVRKYPDKEKVGGLTGLTGGWAGGEVGLQAFREDARATTQERKKEKAEAESKVIYNTKTNEVVDIDMSKDFGSMTGGWPGGEKGVMMFSETGEIVENKQPPTLGWGPLVLALALAGSYGYYVYETDPLVEVEQSDGSTVQIKSLSVKSKEAAPPPEAQALALKVAPYGAAAAGVGAVVVITASGLKKAVSSFGAVAGKGIKIGVLAAVTGVLAAKILGVL